MPFFEFLRLEFTITNKKPEGRLTASQSNNNHFLLSLIIISSVRFFRSYHRQCHRNPSTESSCRQFKLRWQHFVSNIFTSLGGILSSEKHYPIGIKCLKTIDERIWSTLSYPINNLVELVYENHLVQHRFWENYIRKYIQVKFIVDLVRNWTAWTYSQGSTEIICISYTV